MSGSVAVMRRDLVGFFRAPIAYAVGAVFLLFQGLAFAAVVRVLSDPRGPAESGAVLSTFFAGTFASWAVVLAVVSAIAMRSCAEERQTGTWELLLAAPRGIGSILAGKWLAALTFYCLLWLPTVAYLPVLGAFTPAGASVDHGPIVSAYLAVFAVGAVLIAMALAASVATRSQVIAGVTTFAAGLALLLLGEVDSIAPDLGEQWPLAGDVLGAIDIRAQVEWAARGELLSAPALLAAGATFFFASLATAIASRPIESSRARRVRLLSLALVAVCVALASALGARHPLRLDTTAPRIHTLEPSTRRVLQNLEGGARIVSVVPTAEAFEGVHRELGRLLERMREQQPALAVENLDPLADPMQVEALADEMGLQPGDLAELGGLVVEVEGRRAHLELLALAEFRPDDLGAGKLASLHAESAVAEALDRLAERERHTVCASIGHGELPLRAVRGPNWSPISARLRRASFRLEEARLGVDSLAGCDVVIVAGPLEPVGADAAMALAAYLDQGGSALVATREQPVRPTGLEEVVARYGITLPLATVVDPENATDISGQFAVVSGYADHPITRRFQDRRVTIWDAPRAVLATKPAIPLIRAADEARLETDSEALEAPASFAAAAEREGSRIVVVGAAGSLSSALGGRGDAGELLVASAVDWLIRRQPEAELAAKTPEHIRLVMTRSDVLAVTLVCAGGIPLFWIAMGAFLWWRRRR